MFKDKTQCALYNTKSKYSPLPYILLICATGGSLKWAEFLADVCSKCKVRRFRRGVLLADATSFPVLLMTGLTVASPSTLSWPFSNMGLARVLVTRRWAFSVSKKGFRPLKFQLAKCVTEDHFLIKFIWALFSTSRVLSEYFYKSLFDKPSCGRFIRITFENIEDISFSLWVAYRIPSDR